MSQCLCLCIWYCYAHLLNLLHTHIPKNGEHSIPYYNFMNVLWALPIALSALCLNLIVIRDTFYRLAFGSSLFHIHVVRSFKRQKLLIVVQQWACSFCCCCFFFSSLVVCSLQFTNFRFLLFLPDFVVTALVYASDILGCSYCSFVFCFFTLFIYLHPTRTELCSIRFDQLYYVCINCIYSFFEKRTKRWERFFNDANIR